MAIIKTGLVIIWVMFIVHQRVWLRIEKQILDMEKREIKEKNQGDAVYEVITDGMGAYNGNRYLRNAIRHNPNKVIWSAQEGRQMDSKEKGGIIVFPTDDNAVKLDVDHLINWVKQKALLIASDATEQAAANADSNTSVVWNIGNYLSGTYNAKDGQFFGAESLSIEVVGTDFDTLLTIAEQLCATFHQPSVLLKDYSTDQVLIVAIN